MVELHETFIGAIGTVAVGQALRRIFLRSSEQKRYIMLMSRVLIYVTIPATLFRTMSNVRQMPWDGLYLLLCCLVYECAAAALAALLFRRVSRPYRGVTVGSSVSFAIGMFFFGIIENLAGDRGVMYLAFFDVPNAFFVYIGQPLMFHFLSLPDKKTDANDTTSAVTIAVDEHRRSIELEQQHDKEEEGGEDAEVHKKELLTTSQRAEEEEEQQGGDHDSSAEAVDESAEGSSSSNAGNNTLIEGEWSPATFAKRLLGNMSLWGIAIGLVLGLTGVQLPVVITNFVNIAANANSCVSYLLIGLYLDVDLATLRRLWRHALLSLAYRYGLGITVGIVLYFTLGTSFSPLARLIVLVGFCMPLPASVTALAAENGVDPSLPAFVTNLTFIVSFGVLWTMIALAGVPTEEVLSSSSSPLSSSALGLSSSA